MVAIATSQSLSVSPQAKQTVYHIIASIYNAKDIAEELLDLDCALDAPDEEVRHVHSCWKFVTHHTSFRATQPYMWRI